MACRERAFSRSFFQGLRVSPLRRSEYFGKGHTKRRPKRMARPAQGGAVSSEGRGDPVAGCRHPPRVHLCGRGIPPLPDPRPARPLRRRFGARPPKVEQCVPKKDALGMSGFVVVKFNGSGRGIPFAARIPLCDALSRRFSVTHPACVSGISSWDLVQRPKDSPATGSERRILPICLFTRQIF